MSDKYLAHGVLKITCQIKGILLTIITVATDELYYTDLVISNVQSATLNTMDQQIKDILFEVANLNNIIELAVAESGSLIDAHDKGPSSEDTN